MRFLVSRTIYAEYAKSPRPYILKCAISCKRAFQREAICLTSAPLHPHTTIFPAKRIPSVKVDLFDFELPQSCIAQHPAQPKDTARLLVVGDQRLDDKSVLDLADQLAPGDIMVFNDTKVIPASLTG